MPFHFEKTPTDLLKIHFSILQQCFIRGPAQNTEVQGALADTARSKTPPLAPCPTLKNYLLVCTHPLADFKKLGIFGAQEFTTPHPKQVVVATCMHLFSGTAGDTSAVLI